MAEPVTTHPGASSAGPKGLWSRVVGSIGHLAVGQAISWLIRPLTILLISRQLGPAATGSLVLALSVWRVLGLATDFGMERLVPQELAQDPGAASTMTKNAVRVLAQVAVMVWVALVALLVVLPVENATVALYAVVGLSTITTRIGLVYVSSVRGLERTSSIPRSEAASKGIELIAVVWLLQVTDRLEVIVAGFALGGIIKMIWMHIEFQRLKLAPTVTSRQDLSIRAMVRRAAPLLVFALIVVVYREVDVVVMAGLVDNEVLGWYGAADRLYGSAQFAATIAGAALFPVFAQLYASRDQQLVELLRKSVTGLWAVSVAVGLGTLLTGQRIVEFLFGAPFSPGGDVLQVLGLALIPGHLTILFGIYAVAIGEHRRWATLQAGAILATFVLDLILVPLTDDRYGNGALGGAWSYVIVEIAILAIGIPMVAPHLVDRQLATAVARILVAGAIMSGAVLAVRDMPLVAVIAVGAIVYGIAIVALRVLPMPTSMVRP